MGRYFSTGIGRLFFYIYICLPRFLTFYIGTLAWVKWYRTDVLKHINAMAECAATASAWWQQFGQFKYYRVVWYDSDLCDGHIQSQCLQSHLTAPFTPFKHNLCFYEATTLFYLRLWKEKCWDLFFFQLRLG